MKEESIEMNLTAERRRKGRKRKAKIPKYMCPKQAKQTEADKIIK